MNIIKILTGKIRFYEKRLVDYKKKRENVLSGRINCIPSPFERFKREFPGIEKAKYYGITGNQKSAKTQLADFIFLLWTITYAFENKDKLRLKIFYFSLEMSIQEKFDQFTCYWLYKSTGGRIRIDTKQLNSLNSNNPISTEILEILESKEYREFFDFIEDNVIFNEDVRNPFGIYKQCKTYAENHGKLHYKEMDWKEDDGSISKRKVIDFYESDYPDEYRIVIIDHLSLLTPEKGEDLRGTIGKFSSNHCVQLRNIYGYSVVSIQQQAAAQESIENLKMDRIMPTADGLADNKTTSRDFNVLLGIFSPYRFKKSTWEGYNIKEFEDNIRFLEVILNRNGTSGDVCPLYFDGAVNIFAELPLPNEKEKINKFLKLKYQQ